MLFTFFCCSNNVSAAKKLIVIDTCNAGKLGEQLQMAMLTRGMSEDTAIKILSRSVGSTIIYASTSLQEALEGYKVHGLFNYVLTEGMRGKADASHSGYVKRSDLVSYVEETVPEIAESFFKRAQYPTKAVNGQDFPIGRMKTSPIKRLQRYFPTRNGLWSSGRDIARFP